MPARLIKPSPGRVVYFVNNDPLIPVVPATRSQTIQLETGEVSMALHSRSSVRLDRRKFLQGIGGSVAAGVLSSTQVASATAQVAPEAISRAGAGRPLSDHEKMVRIASN